jgi:hypothetical protein
MRSDSFSNLPVMEFHFRHLQPVTAGAVLLIYFRCFLYATEQADPDLDDPEVRDITNEKFWRKLQSISQHR